MPTKPTTLSILQTYSLDELMDMAREKATMESQQKFQAIRDQLRVMESMVSGEEQPASGTMRMRRAGKSTRGRKPAGEPSLRDYLLKALGSDPMNVEQILEAITAMGYHSQAQDPRRVLYLELNKLANSGKVKKAGRGLYLQA